MNTTKHGQGEGMKYRVVEGVNGFGDLVFDSQYQPSYFMDWRAIKTSTTLQQAWDEIERHKSQNVKVIHKDVATEPPQQGSK